jgi:hypothetical protein
LGPAILGVGACSVLLPARAEDATEAIRIDYHAEPGCPSAEEFSRQVFERTSSARLAREGDTARTFVVVIARRSAGLTGSLVVRETDGSTASREVVGPDCSEVATVLALATALAIDPEASLVTHPEEKPAPPPPPPAPAPAARAPVAPEPEPESGTAPAWGPRAFVVTLGPSAEFRVTPRAAFGGSIGAGFRPTEKMALSALSAEVTLLRSPRASLGGAYSEYQLFYVRPTACAFALTWAGDSGIAPCLGGELGAVRGWGRQLPNPATRSRAWVTVDVSARVDQSLGDTWFVEGDAGIVLPITRWHYVFREPDTSIFAVPALAATFTLRAGARIW